MAFALTRFITILYCLLLALNSAVASASESVTAVLLKQETEQGPLLKQQRKIYQEAQQALSRSQFTRYRVLRTQLDDYPLTPYLDFAELRPRLYRFPQTEVNQFLKQYPDSILANRLRSQWLRVLATSQRWDSYLSFYLPQTSDPELQCYYLRALYGTGQKEQALQDIAQLWLVGKSQPKACDPLFKTWQDDGQMTSALAWRRFDLAMQAGNVGLARYLQRHLTSDQKRLADTYIQMHWTPALVARKESYSHDQRLADVVLHGLRRNSSINPVQTAGLWQHYRSIYHYDPESEQALQRRIAAAMSVSGYDGITNWLLQVDPTGKDPELLERRIMDALAHQQWDNVKNWVAQLPEDLAADPRWRYWLARALEQTGAREAAVPLYQNLATTRSFYGFLAADNLRQGYAMEDQSSMPTAEQIAATLSLPGIRRAREFRAIGQVYDARREWLQTTYQLDDEQLAIAAQLAQSWGWYPQAIFALAQGEQWNELSIRFPLAYTDLIQSAARKTQLDANWIYAVVRQESALAADVYSGAGAMGLMQLMPATARQVARKSGVRLEGKYALLDPATNITLGTQYLKDMLRHYQGNRVLASAAYNAGPGRVDRWMPRIPNTLPLDIWIENIPFRETREYVKNILTFSVIYGYRRGEQTALLQDQEYTLFARLDAKN